MADNELFHITFVEEDLDWMAEEAGVTMEVAVDRAKANAKYIRDYFTEQINGALLDAVRGY